MLDPSRLALNAETVGFRRRMKQGVDMQAFRRELQRQTDTIKVRREMKETPISEVHAMGAERFGIGGNQKTNERIRQQRQINGYPLRQFSAAGPIVLPSKHLDGLLQTPVNVGLTQYTQYNATVGNYVSRFTEPNVSHTFNDMPMVKESVQAFAQQSHEQMVQNVTDWQNRKSADYQNRLAGFRGEVGVPQNGRKGSASQRITQAAVVPERLTNALPFAHPEAVLPPDHMNDFDLTGLYPPESIDEINRIQSQAYADSIGLGYPVAAEEGLSYNQRAKRERRGEYTVFLKERFNKKDAFQKLVANRRKQQAQMTGVVGEGPLSAAEAAEAGLEASESAPNYHELGNIGQSQALFMNQALSNYHPVAETEGELAEGFNRRYGLKMDYLGAQITPVAKYTPPAASIGAETVPASTFRQRIAQNKKQFYDTVAFKASPEAVEKVRKSREGRTQRMSSGSFTPAAGSAMSKRIGYLESQKQFPPTPRNINFVEY